LIPNYRFVVTEHATPGLANGRRGLDATSIRVGFEATDEFFKNG
jgi:hypothetical protein